VNAITRYVILLTVCQEFRLDYSIQYGTNDYSCTGAIVRISCPQHDPIHALPIHRSHNNAQQQQHTQAELKGSWMEIAKHLPHRSVQSVYRHGIRQLHPFKRGAWSEQETVTLSDLVTRLGKKWSAIQTKLNRSADSCRDKYREMSDDYVKGRWKEQEMELLRRLVREHLNADETTDMKALGRMVEDQGIQIPWSNISKRIGKRSRLSCFKKWQKMAGLLSASEENRRRKGDDDDDDEHATAAAANIGNNSTNNNNNNMSNKRAKLEEATHVAATAGAAAAMAAAATDDYDEQVYNSVKMAEETVEAVDLPDVDVAATAHI